MINIGQFGYRIKIFEASTILEANAGVRDHYETKDAMFSNSLFCDYLSNNGLKEKNDYTRDIICLEFNYGCRSYEMELAHLHKVAKQARCQYRAAKVKHDAVLMERYKNKVDKVTSLLRDAYANRLNYRKLNKAEVRRIIYNDGVNITYVTRRSNGEISKTETIHYRMLYRSTGKAKKGSCMFICDRLYAMAHKFLYMGIELTDDNPMIVEASAYVPLVSSSIVGKVRIHPNNILVLKDVDRKFMTNVISVETDAKRQCVARAIDDYELKNTLFDGQALIDSSIFPDWGNGYILLRHHFCKMAAFNCNIQKFFKDYFGDDYFYATVKDMWGKVHYVKDIECICTESAMKWTKFGKSYNYWCKKVYDNDCMFGIVKTAHESKLGEMQRMSYQMVNSLSEEIMNDVMKASLDYVDSLKLDDNVFLDFLEKNANFANDYDALVALCRNNPQFTRSVYFRRRKEYIMKTYVLNLKSGHIIQNADNLVIVGSPYAMLLYAASGNDSSVDYDTTFKCEDGAIQCYTERFDDGEYLAGFRSPFNSKNNMDYLHNVYDYRFKEYFTFGKQIIAVNMIGTDFQDRNNGSDQDSDSLYVTNQKQIAEYASHCYNNYPTIVNNIPKEKNVYDLTMDSYAYVDSNLAEAQIAIGESSNLAQLCLTYTYNFDDVKYRDYVCILSVLAQVAIDSAKRRFDIDITNEIDRIKSDMDVKKNGYPLFWSIIRRGFNAANINKDLTCPMNCLYNMTVKKYRSSESTLPMSYFFQKFELEKTRKTCSRIEDIINRYSLDLYNYNVTEERDDTFLLLRSDFDNMINEIRSIYVSRTYVGLFSWLIDRAFVINPGNKRNVGTIKSTINKNKSLLLKTLYEVNADSLMKCFSKNLYT